MRVEAAATAFLWKFGKTSFKATYGRYSGDNEYSKNYLQTDAGEVRDTLTSVLAHSGTAGEQVAFDIRWPEGHLSSKFNIKNTGTDRRGEVYVTKATSVESKTVTEPFVPGDPVNPNKALSGDNLLPTADDANNLMQSIMASGINPWFMLVALEGEERTLHARMILENPPAGKEQYGLDRQPAAIQDAIRKAAIDASSIVVDLRVRTRATKIVDKVQDALRRSPNVLLVGPPGCGKTIAVEDLSSLYADTAWFDPSSYDPWRTDSHKIYDTAFHAALSYENFVAGLSPAAGQGINLEVRSGPLVNMAQWCRGSDREGVLLIDEFNRGPAAAIFGDALVLLDKEKRSGNGRRGSTIAQPHSGRDIDVPEEFASAAPESSRRVPKAFSLPHNLKIIGAFNGSDRSVVALDAALLRRFAIVRVGPDPEVLATHLGFDQFDPAERTFIDKTIADWSSEDVRRLAVHILISLNDRIQKVLGADHEVGHALLWEVPADADPLETAAALAAEFEEKIVGRLQQTLRDKDEVLAVILNAPDRGELFDDGIATWLAEDTRIGRLVGPRLQIKNLKDQSFDDQVRRLRSIIVEQ